MARAKEVVDSSTLIKAEEALKGLKEGKLVLQLKAIISSGRHPVENVAEVFQVSTRSIFRWANKFKHKGIEGLKDRPKGHFSSKLTEKNKEKIEEWILAGKNSDGKEIHWTLNKLQMEVDKVFNIHISTVALWNHLNSMDLILKRP